MKVAIGCDEAGFELKGRIIGYLGELGHEVKDFGCHSSDPVDYPDVGFALAKAVADSEFARGVLICGTGIGMAIVANKVPGVRAAVCHDLYSTERARKSNDAQVMTLGARVIGVETAKAMVKVWMESEFQGGGSARKVQKINDGEAARLREA
jgi:ribose 5-phosphate isomerase B